MAKIYHNKSEGKLKLLPEKKNEWSQVYSFKFYELKLVIHFVIEFTD